MSLNIQRMTPNFLSTKNMSLTLNSWSSVAANLRLRGLSENNVLDYTTTTNSDRSKATVDFNLPEFPLNFTVFSDTALERGECYIQVSLNIDVVKCSTLTHSYVSDSFTPQMGYLEDSLNGAGKTYVYVGTDVGANTEISVTVPTNTVWEISKQFKNWLNISVLLTQSGAGGTTREVKKIMFNFCLYWVIQDDAGNMISLKGDMIYKASAGTGSSGSSGDSPNVMSGYGTRGIDNVN